MRWERGGGGSRGTCSGLESELLLYISVLGGYVYILNNSGLLVGLLRGSCQSGTLPHTIERKMLHYVQKVALFILNKNNLLEREKIVQNYNLVLDKWAKGCYTTGKKTKSRLGGGKSRTLKGEISILSDLEDPEAGLESDFLFLKDLFIKNVRIENKDFLTELEQYDILLENSKSLDEVNAVLKTILATYEERVLNK